MIPELALWNEGPAMTNGTTKEAAVAAEALLFDDWFDAIEDGVRARVRGFIETMLESGAFPRRCRVRARGRRRPGEDEATPSVIGVRHGHREPDADEARSARPRIAVPRARIDRRGRQDARMAERFAARLPAPHPGRRRLDRRGLSRGDQHPPRATRVERGLCRAPVGKDVVSRVWRKTKGDWDAWAARSLAEGKPIVRLILDGTIARVRLDRKATSISLLVALGVRADGQKMLLAIKSMGGEGEAAWRALLRDDFVRRGLRAPELAVVVDGAPGLEGAGGAVARLWLSNACTVHKQSNLLAHAPERLHEEISNDCRDLSLRRDARRVEPGARRSSANGASNAEPSPTAWRKLATSCSHSRGSRRANGNRSEPRTRSSDCTRSSSAGSRLRPCCPAPKPPPCCSGAPRLRTDHHA